MPGYRTLVLVFLVHLCVAHMHATTDLGMMGLRLCHLSMFLELLPCWKAQAVECLQHEYEFRSPFSEVPARACMYAGGSAGLL